MTTLPYLTPSTKTPVVRSHSSHTFYGPYPPRELSNIWDFVQIPPRLNPTVPLPPQRRIDVSLETVPQHWHNDQRRLLMQKREHERFHSAWSKAFYGSPPEKENYRRHFREGLKQQMADKELNRREELKSRFKESKASVAFDRQCRQDDTKEYHRRQEYLRTFRDDNKRLMEANWACSRLTRSLENRKDMEVLRYNPINWSCTLK